MRYAVCEALKRNGDDAALLAALSRETHSSAWGHRVISSSIEPFSLLEGVDPGNMAALLDMFGDLSIEDAAGPLSSFTEDPLWAGLADAVSSGEASVKSPQWAFS